MVHMQVDLEFRIKFEEFTGINPMDKSVQLFSLDQQIERYIKQLAFWMIEDSKIDVRSLINNSQQTPENISQQDRRIMIMANIISNAKSQIYEHMSNIFDTNTVNVIQNRAIKLCQGQMPTQIPIVQLQNVDKNKKGQCTKCGNQLSQLRIQKKKLNCGNKCKQNGYKQQQTLYKVSQQNGNTLYASKDNITANMQLQSKTEMQIAQSYINKQPLPIGNTIIIKKMGGLNFNHMTNQYQGMLTYRTFTSIDKFNYPKAIDETLEYSEDEQVSPITIIDINDIEYKTIQLLWLPLNDIITAIIKVQGITGQRVFPMKVFLDKDSQWICPIINKIKSMGGKFTNNSI